MIKNRVFSSYYMYTKFNAGGMTHEVPKWQLRFTKPELWRKKKAKRLIAKKSRQYNNRRK